MELQQLRTFATIARTQSFTQASEQLDYAQSSISAQVRLLEESLGVKLFERLGRRVHLTPAGERLLPYAEKLLKLAEEARDVTAGGDLPQGRLVIGAPESISIYRLPVVLQNYRQRYQQVELVLKLGTCSDLFKWLRSNEIDIAVLMDNQISAPDLAVEILRPEAMALVAAANHPLLGRKQVVAADLDGVNLIQIEKDACYRNVFEAQLRAANIQPGSTFEIGSIEAVKKCVASGLGLSLLPQMSVEQELAAGIFAQLPWSGPDFGLYTLMSWHKDKWLSPALMAFIEMLRQNLK